MASRGARELTGRSTAAFFLWQEVVLMELAYLPFIRTYTSGTTGPSAL